MKHKQVFSMNLTGPIDYGFRNDYMFRAALQLSQKALIGLISSLLHLPPSAIKSVVALRTKRKIFSYKIQKPLLKRNLKKDA